VDVEDGREMSWPMDGSEGRSSSEGCAVLKAGRSKPGSGERKESRAAGRGRRADAVVELGRRTRGDAFLSVLCV
jgi:hypothetical protein